MYQYIWDEETGGLLLTTEISKFSKEPRPVYYRELDLLGFNKYWDYPKDDSAPIMWAEANNYIYRGRKIASLKGGALYTAPEIIIHEATPEPNGGMLRFVAIDEMVKKNAVIMETLTQETIQRTYNTYIKYYNKVDIFHVSFSGGKDSLVTLDLVQRALPHNEIIVIFGDTGMEFPDTYHIVEEVKEKCANAGIRFYISKSCYSPLDTWKLFGEPSSAIRWCCGVHKTTPQLLLLRDIIGQHDIKEMAFVGVRGDESIRRSGYDYVSMGTKQKGQYSCNPILDWNSAEVFLYLYMNKITIHKAYKMGSARVGCLLCPMSTNKSDYINYNMYPEYVQPFVDIIYALNSSENGNEAKLFSYVNNKAWKARKNGRDLTIGIRDFTEEKTDSIYKIQFTNNNGILREWLKTLGVFTESEESYTIKTNNDKVFNFSIIQDNSRCILTISKTVAKSNPTFYKDLKNILKKVHSCVGCRACAANCPHGNISFIEGKVIISDDCTHCGLCNDLDHGCLRYKSLWLPKGTGAMKTKSIDSYGTHSPKMEWIKQFVELKERFNVEHKLGSVEFPMFKKFLRDCGVLEKNDSFNTLTQMLFSSYTEDENMWALFFVNLSYSAEVGWLVQHLDFNTNYTQKELIDIISGYIASKTGPRNITNSYKRMSLLPLSQIGFCKVTEGNKADGFNLVRKSWETPDPRVILYSLYKFAEHCGEYYQFTLKTLLDDSIERDGVSPTRIFGLDRDVMEPMLNGLSANYPDFISASFSLGLDTINLHEDKTSQDVLALF